MAVLTPYKNRISAVRWMLTSLVLLALLIIWTLFITGVLQNFKVVSGSMEPTLQIGDRVFMKKEKEFGDLTGRIIVFKDPGGNGEALTKRVVAGASSRVRLRSGMVYLDGAKEPLVGDVIEKVRDRRWDLQADELFVLGDNRNNSMDSIDFGPIKRGSLIGVLTYRYWPLGRSGHLE